jgi:hypothetical protein
MPAAKRNELGLKPTAGNNDNNKNVPLDVKVNKLNTNK